MATTLIQTGIHSGDLIQLLQREGFDVKPWRLRHAAGRGYIPTPFRTASGDHAWSARDIPAIRKYFRDPVLPGRPKKAV